MGREGSTIEMERPRRARGSAPEDTDYQPVDWKRLFLRPKYLVWWIILAVIIILTIIITVYHDKVVEHLRPFAQHVRDLPAGWLIPIAILIVISFPPLFGHEIVALLCGVVYGLWIGFAIVAAGTFLGELGTWFAFKYLLYKKGAKLERTNLDYGALARITRDGGFLIVLIIRFSALPSHFTTAVFSTCGVKFWYFSVATFLTLPKQIFLVYLGVLLLQDKPDSSAKNIVFGIAFAVTICMAVWLWYKMREVKRVLLEEQAERRRLGAISKAGDQLSGNSSAGGADDVGVADPGGDEWLLVDQSGPSKRRDYQVLAQEEMDIGISRTHASTGSHGGSGWTTETLNTPGMATPASTRTDYFAGKPVEGHQYV